MKFRFRCPNCKKSLKFPESSLGKKITCPFCEKKVSHPELKEDLEELKEWYGETATYDLNGAFSQKATEEPEEHPMTSLLMKAQGVPLFIGLALVLLPDSETWVTIGACILLIGIIMVIITSLMPKSGIQFHLFEHEKLISAFSVKNKDDKKFYARLTNKRLVISPYVFGYVIDGFDDIIEALQKPKVVCQEFLLPHIEDYKVAEDHKSISFVIDGKSRQVISKAKNIDQIVKCIGW